jgi:hypothetical protein
LMNIVVLLTFGLADARPDKPGIPP